MMKRFNIDGLDRNFPVIAPGVYLIIAPHGNSKTTLRNQLTLNLIKDGERIVWVNCETPFEYNKHIKQELKKRQKFTDNQIMEVGFYDNNHGSLLEMLTRDWQYYFFDMFERFKNPLFRFYDVVSFLHHRVPPKPKQSVFIFVSPENLSYEVLAKMEKKSKVCIDLRYTNNEDNMTIGIIKKPINVKERTFFMFNQNGELK